jgi:hypothetical protein
MARAKGGDYLFVKMRLSLPTDPRTVAMAHRLKMEPLSLIGHLLACWAWAGREATGDEVANATPAVIDTLFRLPGMAEAMQSVGWLETIPGGLRFPNLREWNYEPGSSTSPEAARKRAYRAKVRSASGTCPVIVPDCPGHDGTTVGHSRDNPGTLLREIEKREIEEEKDPPNPPRGGVGGNEIAKGEAPPKAKAPKTPTEDAPAELPALPPALDVPEVREALGRWLAYRRQIRKTLKPASVEAAVKKLAGYGAAGAVQSIDESISNGWQGLFPPRADEAHGLPPARASPGRAAMPSLDEINAMIAKQRR